MNAVRTVPMFRGLSAKDQAHVFGLATLRDYSRGDIVWHEGDEAENLTIIVTGQVKIVRHGEGGDVILELFGRASPSARSPCTTTCRIPRAPCASNPPRCSCCRAAITSSCSTAIRISRARSFAS
jgi:CRP-like cAMP-binding protein